MSNDIDVFTECTPEQFGAFVKLPASEVRRLVKSGVLPARGTYVEFAGAYIERHRAECERMDAEIERMKAEIERLRAEAENPYPEHSYLHRAYQLAPLDVRCTQGQFGKKVGISQQAVSQLVQKGVIHPEGTFLAWLRDYTRHLEDEARQRRGF
jgi:hypothetical protein